MRKYNSLLYTSDDSALCKIFYESFKSNVCSTARYNA